MVNSDRLCNVVRPVITIRFVSHIFNRACAMKIARFIFFSLFFIIQLSYAGNTGKISGKVTDSKNKEGLIGVNIFVVGTTFGAVTDIEGNYTIIGVRPGTYTVRASLIGYNNVSVTSVVVNIDLTTKQDFVLTETTVEVGEVVIVAERELIQKDITASTSIVNKELISNLAVTEVRDVIQLQAGIAVSPGGDLHLRGGRKGQIAFQIDGVPVTDAYDGSSTIDLGANSVQELQVVSGAFNAEYGQAMSGIVNVVTKDGGDKLAGNIQSFTGMYLSDRTNVFQNIDNRNLYTLNNVELSLSGPVIQDKVYFLSSFRHYYNRGFHFGKRYFTTTDLSREVPGSAGTEYIIWQSGDRKPVPMNPNERYFGQGKLSYRLFQDVRLMYNYIYDEQAYQDYNAGVRYTPGNNLFRYRKTHSNIFTLNHTLSATSFYNLNFSYLFKDYHHYLFENIYTDDTLRPTLYVDNRLKQNPPYSFDIGGTDHSRFQRNTGTMAIKLDWVNQLNKELSLQFGGDFKEHRIFYETMTLRPMLDSAGVEVFPYNVMIPDVTTQDHDIYIHKPQEGALYVQTKFEGFNLIFNAGVRLDYFDPDGVVLNDAHSDPSDPLYYQYTVDDPNINNPIKPDNRFFDYNNNGVQDSLEPSKTVQDRLAYWYKKAQKKTQLSPRLGLAFPISAGGVIHFSYGHFFQLPSYELMYTNPEFELGVGSGNQGLFGNADIQPQKTVKGEIGIKQQLSDDVAVDVTMFFEDFTNLTGTQTEDILVFGGAQSYSKYANSDFGMSKGIVVKFEKRFSEGFAANLDYSFSITKGNASNPADTRNAVTGGALPETYVAPLDWDQTHSLNAVVAYSQPRNWGVSLISNFYSGQPYTPAVNKNSAIKRNTFPRNSDYKPNIFNVDLRANKDVVMGTSTLSLYLRIFNLFDLDNPRSVYANSGDPYFSFDKLSAESIDPKLYYNTLDELYTDPGFFSEPRRIELGTSFTF
ncbi:MAG: TonB-dependent receptor [Bacteroidetes bacterium]|nr:MAG: TonB-dependent receptor [Bacteroidota bacterium]